MALIRCLIFFAACLATATALLGQPLMQEKVSLFDDDDNAPIQSTSGPDWLCVAIGNNYYRVRMNKGNVECATYSSLASTNNCHSANKCWSFFTVYINVIPKADLSNPSTIGYAFHKYLTSPTPAPPTVAPASGPQTTAPTKTTTAPVGETTTAPVQADVTPAPAETTEAPTTAPATKTTVPIATSAAATHVMSLLMAIVACALVL